MRSLSDPPFARAVEAIDVANAADPRATPLALTEGRLAHEWVLRLAPDAGWSLQLAARAHHLGRWLIARSDFPEGRAGYLRWRTALRKRQSELVGAELLAIGVDEVGVARVQALVRKEGLGADPEAQVLEDAICLVFLQTQADTLAARLDDDRMLNAVRKTLAKMSAPGKALAAEVPMSDAARTLLARACAPHMPSA